MRSRLTFSIITLSLVVGGHAHATSLVSSRRDCPHPDCNTTGETVISRQIREQAVAQACPRDPQTQESAQVQRAFDDTFGVNPTRVSGDVHGLRLQGTPEQLEIARGIISENPPPYWRRAAAQCTDVVCAIESLFVVGNDPLHGELAREAALRALITAKRYGYTFSFSQSVNSFPGQSWSPAIWRIDEIQSLHRELERLPPVFHNIPTLKTIYREGMFTGPNIAGYASSDRIVLRQTNVLLHELAHHVDFSLGAHSYHPSTGYTRASEPGRWHSNQQPWSALSGWVNQQRELQCTGGRYCALGQDCTRCDHCASCGPGSPPTIKVEFTHATDARFVTHYATTNPTEDFAESLMVYINNPRSMASDTPEKFRHIRDTLFSGEVYPSPTIAPEVVRAFESWGGYARGIKSCFSSWQSIFETTNYQGKRELRVEFNGSSNWTPDNINIYNDCGVAIAGQLGTLLPEDVVCRLGGTRKVGSQIGALLGRAMGPIVKQIENRVLRPRPAEEETCAGSGPEAFRCKILEAVPSGFRHDPLLESVRLNNQTILEIANIIASKVPSGRAPSRRRSATRQTPSRP